MNLLRPILLLCLGAAMIQTVRLARAEAAARRSPIGGEAQLRRSLDGNPRLSSAWITLGIEAERAGDLAGAEAMLTEAARVDRQFLPAWTLANFYFRRGDPGSFWPWAKRAAALTFDDYRPLLQLCDRLNPHPAEVIERLEGGPPLMRAYVDLLIGERRPAEAQAVSNLLRLSLKP